jgi:carnitine O-acetyltransferase
LAACKVVTNYFNIDGFFDAGMLLQALKARGEGLDDGAASPSERATVNARRREIGKKLRLSEY